MAQNPYLDPETGEIVYPEEDPGNFAPGNNPFPEPPYTPYVAPPGPAPDPQPGPTPPPVTTTPPPPPTTPPPPSGGGGFTGSYNAPPRQAYPTLPEVANAPTPNLPAFRQVDPYVAASPFQFQTYTPETFKAPNPSEINTDPSYQWRKQQGEDSLQRWAAARGTLNDSGTAKSLLEYGGNAASQEYSNIWNRDYNAFNTNEGNRFNAFTANEGNRFGAFKENEGNRAKAYDTNYQTQYADPYKAAYQSAIDTWIPQQETWRAKNDMNRLGYSTQNANVQLDNTQAQDLAWKQFLQSWDQWKHGPLNDQVYGYGMA